MKYFKLLLALILPWILSGCLYTFEPAYQPEDVFFDPAIVGTWQVVDGQELFTFEPWGDKAYQWTSSETPRPFEARLFKLEQQVYLDIYPMKKDGESFSDENLAPYHMVYKAIIRDGEMELQFLDPEWAEQMLKDKKVNVAYVALDDYMKVLTSPTPELRQLLIQFNKEGFNAKNSSKLKKVKGVTQ